MLTFEDIVARDSARWLALDEQTCQMCDAHGPDKRSLTLSCLYDLHEVLPESILRQDVSRNFYYLRICKSCRGRLIGHLAEWRVECMANRGVTKGPDGHVYEVEADPDRNIPVRVHGALVMMTQVEWSDYKAKLAGM